MPTVISPTWLTPDQDQVDVGPWIAMVAGAETVIVHDGHLSDWDPRQEILLRRVVRIQPGFAGQCGLGIGCRLWITASWQVHEAPLGGSSDPMPIELGKGNDSCEITMRIPAGEAAGSISLRCLILLASPGSGADALAAKSEGQLLWDGDGGRPSGTVFRVSGDSALFPILPMDFSTDISLASGAAWQLRWLDPEPSLDAQISSSLRILVNTSIPSIHAMCSSHDHASSLLRSVLKADIVRQLLRRLLRDPAIIKPHAHYARGSLGALLWSLLISLHGPAPDPASVRQADLDDPEASWAGIQAAYGMAKADVKPGDSKKQGHAQEQDVE